MLVPHPAGGGVQGPEPELPLVPLSQPQAPFVQLTHLPPPARQVAS